MSNNAQLLSSGSEVYAKKRKARKEQIAEVTFDVEARKEYLTGFHKRKVHRQNVARELAKKKEYEDKLAARKEAREARKELQQEKIQEYEKIRRQLKIKYGEALSDEEDETVFSDSEDKEDNGSKEPKQSKFKTKTSLTTVTVIEDMDQDDGTFGLPMNSAATMEKAKKKRSREGNGDDDDDQEANDDEDDAVDEDESKRKKQRVGSSSATTLKGARKAAKEKGEKQEKKKKFRYEGKAQRRITAYKDRQRAQRPPGGREGKSKGGRGGKGGGRGRR
ncbi:nucleolar protein 12-domain-containing protein [Mortierella sp. GBAus27b]|nr:hypothetical protein BGX31_011629 [Mortierella sp. GBA43]KAI8361424.1 nucleolar protein 12-domain-containing protein [Mortierella sp. GBAus27b]